MKKANIAVFVSGGGTNLQALIDAEKAGKIPSGTISLVLSDHEDAYALKRAENAGIPSVTLLRKDYEDEKQYEAAMMEVLEKAEIDMIVLAGFLSILSSDFIVKYCERIINVHPSLIPSFCGRGYYGLNVHRAALDYGVKVTGATVHFVNEVPDGGRIILQKAVYIEKGDTPEILQKRVMAQAEHIILPEATEMVASDIARNK